MIKPDNIILETLVGSQMYGLNRPDSDEDVLGVFVAPTSEVLGLRGISKPSVHHTEPDWTYHEVGRFITLAMKCNPTITEVLWAENYRVMTKQGKMLVDNREKFLSDSYVRHAYEGYVFSQARKLNLHGSYGNGRTARYKKHSTHLYRLLMQGSELLQTGRITVRVTPEKRDELLSIGDLSVNDLITKFDVEIKKFRAIESVLPKEPDYDGINKLLLKMRKMTW